ncbi:hypothetical protein HK405_010576 [Cladochytrium tenue]|nr:hypothetical protein HK405_010576 [Cladochytrium tenue]
MQFQITPMPTAENGLATYVVDLGNTATVTQTWNTGAYSVSGTTVTFAETDDQPSPGVVLSFDAASGVTCSGGSFSPALKGALSATLNGQAVSIALSGSGLSVAGSGAQAAVAATITTAAAAAVAATGSVKTVTATTTVYVTVKA